MISIRTSMSLAEMLPVMQLISYQRECHVAGDAKHSPSVQERVIHGLKDRINRHDFCS
jgi:hypothetical protein